MKKALHPLFAAVIFLRVALVVVFNQGLALEKLEIPSELSTSARRGKNVLRLIVPFISLDSASTAKQRNNRFTGSLTGIHE